MLLWIKERVSNFFFFENQVMKYKINVRDYFGKNYDELILMKALYYIYETAKNSKKSTVFAKTIVLTVVSDPRACAIVLRKYMKDHSGSTFEDIKGAFEVLEKMAGYNWKQYWKYSSSDKGVYFWNKKTDQVIKFLSFDKYDSITGLSLGAGTGRYWSIIWLEEPIQKNDTSLKTITDEELVSNFTAIVSTCFRGILPEKGRRRILISYNDWRPDSYFKKRYISNYIIKNENKLVKYGKQFLYDPNAFEGQGGLFVFSGAGVNEFTDEQTKKFYKELKKYDYEMYKVVVLGCGSNIEGSAYGNNLRRVYKVNKQNIKKGVLHFGIDYSSSKDETVCTATLISDNWWNLQIVDKWSYKDKDAKIGTKLTDPEQIANIWKFICKTLVKFKPWLNGRISKIFVDSKDVVVKNYLNEYWKKSEFREVVDMCQSASKFGIAGKNIRVYGLRMLMAMGRVGVVDEHYDYYMSEWKNRVFLKNGQIKDGNDDASQSFEYSFSNYFTSIFTTEQINILKGLQIGVYE